MTAVPAADRRRFLQTLAGLAAVTASVRVGYGLWSKGAALPPLAVPAGVGALTANRLRKFHVRYDQAFVGGGATALRSQVSRDIFAFRSSAEWQETIVLWISLGGWAYCADQLLDVSLLADVDVRRTCAAHLAGTPSPLVSAATHGPRILALHRTETDALAASYWLELRRRLGI